MRFLEKFKEKVTEFVKANSETFSAEKVKTGLGKTRVNFLMRLKSAIGLNRKIDQSLLDQIEEILITSDVGIRATTKIIQALKDYSKKVELTSNEEIFDVIKTEILKIFDESSQLLNLNPFEISDVSKPNTIVVVGVNGVGKTTTIGKLAYNYRKLQKSVLIGAADTFRAAANEQLEIWAQRAGVPIIQQRPGADPASVAYDTLNSAIAKGIDVVIIDTAGRLHNKIHLMSELDKIIRVMRKLKQNVPNEVLLVLDATTGQNAIQQAKEFMKVAPISGIVLTKLDGTAKGGVIVPIAMELKIPVKFIGVGEKIDDLQPFNPIFFVDALFEGN
ncbi:MAG: signal recognition particle-docking protein FtsY [Candidatus Kapaibacteriales bacterium]